MRLIPAAFACLLLVSASPSEAQLIRFVRESLQFTLAADSFSFLGLYYFDNPGHAHARQAIYYPYVISGSSPDSTSVVEVHGGTTIPVRTGRSGISFVVDMPRFSTQVYRVLFDQHAPERSLEYILKTTAAWGQPLDLMTIRINVPSDIVLKSVSLKPESVRTTEGVTTYTIERERFMPDQNLVIRWGRRIP